MIRNELCRPLGDLDRLKLITNPPLKRWAIIECPKGTTTLGNPIPVPHQSDKNNRAITAPATTRCDHNSDGDTKLHRTAWVVQHICAAHSTHRSTNLPIQLIRRQRSEISLRHQSCDESDNPPTHQRSHISEILHNSANPLGTTPIPYNFNLAKNATTIRSGTPHPFSTFQS